MKLTELFDYEARPGTVTEWRMHPTAVTAAAAAPLDDRPLAYVQEWHTRISAHRQLNNLRKQPTWLATAFDLPGELDHAAFDEALRSWTRRQDTLRSDCRIQGDRVQRHMVSPQDVAFEQVIVGELTSKDAVHEYMLELFDTTIDPLTWPAYAIATVHGKDWSTVYIGIDHLHVDGYALAIIVREIHELYSAAKEKRHPDLPSPGNYADFGQMEREDAQLVSDSHPAVQHWREFLSSSGGKHPTFPLELAVSPGEEPPQGGGFQWLLNTDETRSFDKHCRQHQGSFFAGILGAAAVTAYELGGQDVFRTVCPANTRSEAKWVASLGWFMNLIPIEIPMNETRDFGDVVRVATRAIQASRVVANVPFAKVFELFGNAYIPLSTISYVDARNIAGCGSWKEWNAQLFGRPSFGENVSLWAARTREGLYLSHLYPNTDLGYKNVYRYIEHMREVLFRVATQGAYTLNSWEVKSGI